MAEVYILVTNEYVKSIVCKYVVNSPEYESFLIPKYFSEFFETKLGFLTIVYPLFLLKNFIYNVRWYISESYLKDIRTLNWKVDLKEFWSKLQPHWYEGIFHNTISWLPYLEFDNSYVNFELRFVLDNLGSSEEPFKEPFEELKCCFAYKDNDKDVYRLAFSHEYIESNFFDKLVNPRFYIPYVPYVPVLTGSIKLREVYNTIVTLYKESPEKYAIKDGFLGLKRSLEDSLEGSLEGSLEEPIVTQ